MQLSLRVDFGDAGIGKQVQRQVALQYQRTLRGAGGPGSQKVSERGGR